MALETFPLASKSETSRHSLGAIPSFKIDGAPLNKTETKNKEKNYKDGLAGVKHDIDQTTAQLLHEKRAFHTHTAPIAANPVVTRSTHRRAAGDA